MAWHFYDNRTNGIAETFVLLAPRKRFWLVVTTRSEKYETSQPLLRGKNPKFQLLFVVVVIATNDEKI